ncbi:MAG: putative serine protease PepD [Actinomycetota bacterium]|nr:putative serine protease PepD [Actinomycetota bacterium]
MKIKTLIAAFLVVFMGACSGLGTFRNDTAASDKLAAAGSVASDGAVVLDPNIDLTQSTGDSPHSSTADVVEKVLPSVVNVRVTALNVDALGQPVEGKGEGSGVIIDSSGIILTNNHVVAGATEVKIVFNDGRDPVAGQVVGTDPLEDVAVVKVPEGGLQAIELGQSDSLRLGDDVIAVGFPLGLGGVTVTKGIVSAIDRTIDVGSSGGEAEHLKNLLQTDAAINPGNSGGALVDSAGRLVGINTAAAQAGSAENIGFAIPIDGALPVARSIIRDPQAPRPWLGVTIQSVDSAAVAGQLDLDSDVRGAYVADLFPDSAAADAGIQKGDVITRIGDQEVDSGTALTSALSHYSPGDEVEVELVRDGETVVVTATLGTRPTGLQ